MTVPYFFRKEQSKKRRNFLAFLKTDKRVEDKFKEICPPTSALLPPQERDILKKMVTGKINLGDLTSN